MADIEFFYLEDGQSANVRILSKSVSSIEKKWVHTVKVGDKNKKFTCIAKNAIEECPFCQAARNYVDGIQEASQRLVIHLLDYTDNKEKIWNRTVNANFIGVLKQVEESWGNLCNCVLSIKRNGAQFPTYTVTVLNPAQYPPVDESLVDVDVGYRISSYRSKEEMEEFLRTGVMPDHKKQEKKFVPRSEAQSRFANASSYVPQGVQSAGYAQVPQQTQAPIPITPVKPARDYRDPFARG